MANKSVPRFNPRGGDRRGPRQMPGRSASSLWYGLAFLLVLGVAQLYFLASAGRSVSYSEFKQLLKSGKVVHGWAVEGDLDPDLAQSNEAEIEWPVRSGRRMLVPEVDHVAWFDATEGRRRLHPAQAAFIDRLEAELG